MSRLNVVRDFKRQQRSIAEQLEPYFSKDADVRNDSIPGLEVQELDHRSARDLAFADTVPAAEHPTPDVENQPVVLTSGDEADKQALADCWAAFEKDLHEYAVAITVKEFLDAHPEHLQANPGLYIKAGISIKRSQIEFAKTRSDDAPVTSQVHAADLSVNPLISMIGGLKAWVCEDANSPVVVCVGLVGLYWVGRALGFH